MNHSARIRCCKGANILLVLLLILPPSFSFAFINTQCSTPKEREKKRKKFCFIAQSHGWCRIQSLLLCLYWSICSASMLFFVSIIILSFAHFLETASKPKISCERVSWLSTRTMNTPKQFLWARDALASRSKRMKECQKREEPRKKCDAPIKNRILFSSSLLFSCFFSCAVPYQSHQCV